MKRIGFFIVALIALNTVNAQVTKVLFLGNSYTGYNNLPNMVVELAKSLGDSVYEDRSTPGGHTFSGHAVNASSLSKINQDQWDFVVLQEQSQIPSLPQSITGSDYSPPHAMTLNSQIKNNNSCTETVFYMTWGRKNGDASFCGQHPPVCTYAGMQQELRNSYMSMATANSATVAPVGVAWKNMRDSFPTVDLYHPDESHPSLHGSYLAACVFYSTFFQKSSIGATYVPVGIGTGDAFNIQTIATNTVLDSLSLWRINANHPIADFNFSGGGTINFSNTSTNGQTYYWDFGDGNNSTQMNPSHTYAANNNYQVQLIVYSQDSCFTDTITKNVNVIAASLDEETSISAFKVYPNPAKDVIFIQNTEGIVKLECYDVTGKIVLEPDATNTIDISTLPKGMYFFKALLSNGEQSLTKVMKR